MPQAAGQIIIAHLSDFHLGKSKDTLVKGINTYDRFNQIIEMASSRPYDYMVLSGDLSNDGSIESYHLLLKKIKHLKIKVYLCHGNKDNETNMLSVLSNQQEIAIKQTINFDDWSFFFVNTVVPGENYGQLSNSEIEKVKLYIEGSKARKLGLIMHHNLLPVDSLLLDQYMVNNGRSLINTIAQEPRMKLVMFGHVHNAYSLLEQHIQFESTPATCYQIKKHSDDYESCVDPEKYGYKEYSFSGEKFSTKIIWGITTNNL